VDILGSQLLAKIMYFDLAVERILVLLFLQGLVYFGVFSSWGEKFWGITSDVSRDVGRGVRIIIKKTNYITRLETVRRIY
jgi:hypothetical protein